MKIVYLANSAIPSRSANSVHVMRMADALTAAGADVDVVTLDRPETDGQVDDIHAFYGTSGAFDVVRLPWRRRSTAFMGYAARVPGIVRRLGGEVAYGRFLPACWATARRRIPTWYEAHGPPRGIMARTLFSDLVRRSSWRGAVVISDALRRIMMDEWPRLLPPHVLHDAAADLGRPGPPSGRFRIGYVGHLYKGRGIDTMIEAARRLPAVPFDVVGGTDEDVHRWRRDGLPANMTLHGFVPPAATEAFRQEAWALLAPYGRLVSGTMGTEDTSRWMSPLKVFEYMASGRAIIASDLPVLHEVLRDEHNALLVEPEDPEAWVEAIDRLKQDSRLCGRLGRQARRDFEAQFSWDARARHILQMIDA